ncbi:MAG: hypothetical protein JWM11_5910 [Planctomycetaceae bacterium]|nr:hypothetical protein [Planctomycetaceae bacterium]
MNICEKIDAFEAHVLTRQLRIGQVLGDRFMSNQIGDPLSESAFAIISICFSYFEMIEQFSVGQSSHGRSGEFFKRGFARVFPNSAVNLDDVAHLYSMLRCGMYHTAMPTDNCGLTRELSTAIAKENGIIVINPARLIDSLINHFQDFCSDLRSGRDCDLRRSFEAMFDSLSSGVTVTSTKTETTRAPWIP